jgi:hypothetical protein
MLITITIHHRHHYLIIHTIYSHHSIHLFQTSFRIHLNLNREHNLGTITVPVPRDISIVDMTEGTMNSIGEIILMIGDIPSMEGIPSTMEGITLMINGTIFILIEGRTSVTEQWGDRCTLKLWREEGFLHTFHEAPHFRTTLEGNPRCTVGDHRTLHLVNLLGGLCRIGDPRTLLLPGTRWSHQFPMEEAGAMDDVITVGSADVCDGREGLIFPVS